MRRLASSCLTIALVLTASSALAQSAAPTHVPLSNFAMPSFSAEAEPPQARIPVPSRGFVIRLYAAGWLGGGDGFSIGGGAGFFPFDSNQHEIQVNVGFLHIEGGNGYAFDFDYLYNFRLSGKNYTPYAGAGVNFADACEGCDGDAAFQIGGGIKKPLRNGRELFGEIYFAFFGDTTTILRGGVGF
jgi:hypothetical protein